METNNPRKTESEIIKLEIKEFSKKIEIQNNYFLLSLIKKKV